MAKMSRAGPCPGPIPRLLAGFCNFHTASINLEIDGPGWPPFPAVFGRSVTPALWSALCRQPKKTNAFIARSRAYLRQEVQAPATAIADFLAIIIEDARRLKLDGLMSDLDRMQSATTRLTSFVQSLIADSASDRRQNEGMDEFHRRLRHDLRTPLNAIIGYSDDNTVHDVLSATLGREGYFLLHARDGAEALEIMRRTPPDVVTLDVQLPKIDGWSVLGIMKSEPALEHIPVIMLTIVDDRSLGFSLGASEFMTKPVDRVKLTALLRKLAPAKKNATILIVDDDADVRAVVRSTVEAAGLKSAEAANGRLALGWLSDHPAPALILLDLMMPEVDGFEFLEKIKTIDSLAEVPIVVLTAKDLSEKERNFLTERTLLVLSKSGQPLGSLGAALSALARRNQDAVPVKE